MEVGIVGLGAMGQAMARNLAAAGHRVRAWNRSGGSVEGVTMVDTVAEVFQGDAVLTMLSDDAVIRSVLIDSGVLAGARKGLVHVVTATISVAFAKELAALHGQLGLGYVSAPVLGRPDVAARGELQVLAGGEAGDVETVRPLLEVIGAKVWPMGPEPAAANAAKIACNMMITMAIEAMAEGIALTESNGLARDQFFDLILGTLFNSRPYHVYSAIIAKGEYQAGFKASLGLKDLRLAKAATEDLGAPLPMLDIVHGRLSDVVASGQGERDWSILAEATLAAGRRG